MLLVLKMIASYLKPNSNSSDGIIRLRESIKFSERKKNQNLSRSLIASICFLMCIVFVPERATSIASICERYNSAMACQVW